MVSAEPGPETSDAGPAAVPAQGSPPDAPLQAVPAADAQAVPGADAQAVPAADAGPAASPRRLRKGRLLLILGIVVLSLFVVGGVAGLIVYNEATKIDRSTPAVSVDQFLQAALVDKDVNRLGLFTCSNWKAADAFAQLRPLVGPTVSASWGVVSIASTDRDHAQAIVRVRLLVQAGQQAARLNQTWRIELADQDGWRVCSVTNDPSLNP